MDRPERVAIIDGGVGGLVTGLALTEAGIGADVYEYELYNRQKAMGS